VVESIIPVSSARFSIGELVHHKLFDYRGVIVDVDPQFQLNDEWYDQVALSRPPKDQPWYHVLVNDTVNSTYVAERNLEPDPGGEAINHPLISHFFVRLENGRYVKDAMTN